MLRTLNKTDLVEAGWMDGWKRAYDLLTAIKECQGIANFLSYHLI